MGKHRLPRKDELFNDYLNGSANYLQKVNASTGIANWERLSLTAAEAAQWENFRKDWNKSYGQVMKNRSRGIRDSVATEIKNKDRAAFTKWLLNPGMNKLIRIAGSPKVKSTDRSVFNITLASKKRKSRPHITTAPMVNLSVLDGGMILITCRERTDSDRSSLHPHADDIEMKYILVDVNAPKPASPEDCPTTESSTRAIFRFEGGVNHAGKRLYAYLRWRNLSDIHKSGPWSQIKTTVVGS